MQYLCSTVLLTALSLLIRVGDYWSVWKEVGKEVGELKAKVGEADKLLPPVNGWEYLADGGKWESDPTMVCSRQVSPVCREVIVELEGEAKKNFPECAGSYLPVEGVHHRGRPVGFQLINFIVIVKIFVSSKAFLINHGATESNIASTWWISATDQSCVFHKVSLEHNFWIESLSDNHQCNIIIIISTICR